MNKPKIFNEVVLEPNAARINVQLRNALGLMLCRFYGGPLDRGYAWLKLDGAESLTFQSPVAVGPFVAAMLQIPEISIQWCLYFGSRMESAIYTTGVSRHRGFQFVGYVNEP